MRKRYGLLALAGVALVTACSDSSGPGSTPLFSHQITFPDLKDTLQGLPADGAARAKIALPETGLVAREVNVENPAQVGERERVRSRITALALNAAGDQGTLTLAPGFQVTFTLTTAFEANDTSLTFQQFVARVTAALGQSPAVFLGVKASRSPTTPLAVGPGDAFPASQLELEHDVGRPKLRLNITQANLVDAGAGDCTMAALGITPVGCVKVLGVTVGIGAETELRAMNPGVVKAEFEGVVDCAKAVDATLDPDGSFFLKDGVQVLVDAQTENAHDGEHGDEHLTLAEVQAACGATPPADIEIEGEGVLVSASGASPVIRATEVRFEQEDEAVDVEFEGAIDAVGTDNVTVAGRVVKVDANTRIEREGSGESAITLADLHVGEMVEVRAVLDGTGALLAREIKVRE